MFFRFLGKSNHRIKPKYLNRIKKMIFRNNLISKEISVLKFSSYVPQNQIEKRKHGDNRN